MFHRFLNSFVHGFPWIVATCSLIAVIHPPVFTWFTGIYIPVGLAVIMLGMGLSLTSQDFADVKQRPLAIAAGFALQYTIMPVSGYLLAEIFNLSPALSAGLILVACCPGGTASNVIAYLARADLALSVSMTSISTMAAVLATPFITSLAIGNRVEVDTLSLVRDTFLVVLLPVTAGFTLRKFMPGFTRKILPVAPAAAVLAITLIVASILGASKSSFGAAPYKLGLSVILLHVLGFVLGYFASRLLGQTIKASRTVSIEVGMQNSGLGVVLARGNFTDPITALPSAISSIVHSLIGSAVAAYWSRKPSQDERAG